MKSFTQYSCLETCGMVKHCGNTFCSAHPRFLQARSNAQFKKSKFPKMKSYYTNQ